MAIWKLLKKKIFWYKEYIILVFTGSILILGVFIYFSKDENLNSKNVAPKPIIKTIKQDNENVENIKWTKLVPAKTNIKIIFPNPNLFVSIIKNNQVDTNAFIKQYKEYFKILNNNKGKAELIFSFYESNNYLAQVKIEATITLLSKEVLKDIHKINLLKNDS